MARTEIPQLPFVSGFFQPENSHWQVLLQEWEQVVQEYSSRAWFMPGATDCPGGRDEPVPDALFWNCENSNTSALHAAAWRTGLRDTSAGWVSATEVACHRAGKDADDTGVGRIDLVLRSPRNTTYLVEAKLKYCRDGAINWPSVKESWDAALHQLRATRSHGYSNPWMLAVVFLVPYTDGDAEVCWNAFREKLWSNEPHLAAAAKLDKPATWGDDRYPGVGIVGRPLKWGEYGS